MMLFDKREVIEGVTVVHADHPCTYYLFPEQPRFRLDEQGRPVFKFIKYRNPIERADGSRGGGFVIFDVEFVVPEEKVPKIKKVLEDRLPPRRDRSQPAPEVKLATPVYTKGSAKVLLFQESGALVQKVTSPGKPSLYGRNICAVTIELTPEGATVAEKALQGHGGVVQVHYDLFTTAKLPPIRVRGRFHASQFYSFYQTVDTDWNVWGEDSYRETIREKFYESESLSLDFDWGHTTDEKVQSQIRDWAQRSLEDAVERKMIAAATPVSEKNRKNPDGIEDVTRDISSHKISNVAINYKENQVIEWNPAPQGTLPNITNLKDKEGKNIQWKDYALEISADDPFFRTLRVVAQVNADFEGLNIFSVDLEMRYESSDGVTIAGQTFKGPNDVCKLEAFVKGDSRKYTYKYRVNYKGEERSLERGPIESESPFMTVNVGDLGYLLVEVFAGDIDLGTEVESAHVTMTYADPANNVASIESQFALTNDVRSHRAFERAIYVPQSQPYKYRVKYDMKDGREFVTAERESRAPHLYIDDPFSLLETIKIRTFGDLEGHIQNILLDVEYFDDANHYRQQQGFDLNKGKPFADWEFPAIRDGVPCFYSGQYIFRDGTTEEIPRTEVKNRTILVGKKPAKDLELMVEVIPDLIDWTEVKLVTVTFEYSAGEVNERDTLTFRANGSPQIWKIAIQDNSQRTYNWSARFFMVAGPTKQVGPHDSAEEVLVLEVPA